MKNLKLLFACGIILAFLLNINAGVFVNAQSDPVIEITEIGSFDTYIPSFGPNGWAAGVQVQNGIAFVSDMVTALRIINVTEPDNPTPIGHYYESVEELHEMYVEGDLVYLADYHEGFKILNVSDLTNPVLVGTFDDGGEIGRFEIIGDIAYLVDFVDGLEIVNITDITNPTEIVQYDTDINNIYNIEIVNDLAYVSDFVSGTESKIKILNMSDISSINEIAEYTIAGEPFSIEFVSDVGYAPCSYGGLKIFDVSDPLALPELGSHYDGGNAVAIDFYEGYAVIADRDDGLEILDISSPASPVEIASYFDGGSAAGVHVVGDLIFVADGEDGLEILHIARLDSGATTPDLSGIILIVGVAGVLVVIILFAKMRKG
ncbi:MAG: LVIVD repeat-containing protein [Candidatus Thorarchaeota archaeon]